MLLTTRPEVMLFDLDGTLLHTLPQLTGAARKTASALGINPPKEEDMAEFVGNGVVMLLCRVLTGRYDADPSQVDPELLQRARRTFGKFYTEGLNRDFVVYDGVIEGLTAFRKAGIKLGVVSNKPHVFTVPLLGHAGLADFFDAVLGGEVLEQRKPDPEPLFFALGKMGMTDRPGVMVGDSINDVLAGENAGLTTVAFTYGYNGGHDLHTSCCPDYLFDSFYELNELILSLPEK